MRLHNIQALVFLAFQFTIASTAPTNSAIEAKSDLIARNVNCAAGCWSDGYGEVPVGSFSFIMDHRHGCTMTLKTQGNPQQGIVYKLNANGTIACDSTLPFVLSIALSTWNNPDYCSTGIFGFVGGSHYGLAYYADTYIDLGSQPPDTRCWYQAGTITQPRIRCILPVHPPPYP